MAFVLGIVVAHELLLAVACHLNPVAILHGSGIAGTFFLLLHFHVESLFIDSVAVFATNEFGEVEGESVGVEEFEGIGTCQLGLSLSLQGGHAVVEHTDAAVEGAEERVFLFLDDAGDEFALGWKLGIGGAHLGHKRGHKLIDEGLFLVEEGVGKANGTAQNATDDVAGLGIRGQLSISNREADGTDVVGNDAHGHIDIVLQCLLTAIVLLACEALHLLDEGLEDVGIVVGMLALQGAYESLEAHAGVDDVHGELLERAVGLAVELHEDKVPDLDDLGVVLIYQFASRHLGFLFGCTAVDMNL